MRMGLRRQTLWSVESVKRLSWVYDEDDTTKCEKKGASLGIQVFVTTTEVSYLFLRQHELQFAAKF